MVDSRLCDQRVDRGISIDGGRMPQVQSTHQPRASHNTYANAASLINLDRIRRISQAGDP
jgi:hypothetical protein